MSPLEIVGIVAIYLVAWLGGGYVATLGFALWLNTTKWARTAELAFFGPVLLFGICWLVIGGGGGLIWAVAIIARNWP